jgi:transcriptional regulator with XRE-family HTH domain
MVRDTAKQNSNRKADLAVPESELSNFPVRLRLTIPAGTSLDVFAEKIGVSISGLKKWLAGNAEPGLSYLCAIARVTDASLNWLCGGEVSTPRDCDYEVERLRAVMARLQDLPRSPATQEKIDHCSTGIQLTERVRAAMVRERELLEQAKSGQSSLGGISRSPGSTQPAAVPIDASALSDIVKTVEEFLAESSRTLPPAKKGELIAVIYEMMAAGELDGERKKPLDRITMTRLLRLIA